MFTRGYPFETAETCRLVAVCLSPLRHWKCCPGDKNQSRCASFMFSWMLVLLTCMILQCIYIYIIFDMYYIELYYYILLYHIRLHYIIFFILLILYHMILKLYGIKRYSTILHYIILYYILYITYMYIYIHIAPYSPINVGNIISDYFF